MLDVRIGTMLYGDDAASIIPQVCPHGFECFALEFEDYRTVDLDSAARALEKALSDTPAVVSCLSTYGNPLDPGDDGQAARKTWECLIDKAHSFGTDLVTGFAGRLRGRPVPESVPRFREVFGDLARRAADNGVRLAFENCSMGGSWNDGDWNIAHDPAAWELMFDAVPSASLGLEWEPCHQVLRLIDPVAQLRKWAGKVFHVHGKDATVAWDVLRESGTSGKRQYAWDRAPGFGDTSWTDIITILRQGGYRGTIDIEGWHDPVLRRGLEMTAQVSSLTYLKECRGGDYVRNPVGKHYVQEGGKNPWNEN